MAWHMLLVLHGLAHAAGAARHLVVEGEELQVASFEPHFDSVAAAALEAAVAAWPLVGEGLLNLSGAHHFCLAAAAAAAAGLAHADVAVRRLVAEGLPKASGFDAAVAPQEIGVALVEVEPQKWPLNPHQTAVAAQDANKLLLVWLVGQVVTANNGNAL
jgi:hypothetical protein